MSQLFAGVDEEGFVVCQTLFGGDWPIAEGAPPPFPDGPYTYYPIATKFTAASKPSPTCRLKWINGVVSWVEVASLNDMRVTKNSMINHARLLANRSTFTFQAKQIACDELSRSDIDAVNGVVSLLGVVPITEWKAIDNTYVAIPDKGTWINFYMAMVGAGQANFNKAQTLKTQLASATTAEEISAIKWE